MLLCCCLDCLCCVGFGFRFVLIFGLRLLFLVMGWFVWSVFVMVVGVLLITVFCCGLIVLVYWFFV